MERADELKERIRQQPLNDRLEESRRRIGDMCSKGRCPKMTIPVQHDDDDFYINTTLADAQATIAALQARVRELEARQHFGACAKCLTNAWRICKEGTPDAVEMKCSNGSTWWLCDYCLSKEQLTQRTAELEAAKREVDVWKEKAELRGKEACAQRAELERVRGERDHAKKMEAVQKEVAGNQTWHVQKLHTLILALPKVEGEIVAQAGYVKDRKKVYACFGSVADMTAYAALLTHRQGMEG